MPLHARVLIVDDSRIFRTALEASLTGQGGIQIVGSVFSGQKALEFLQATPADVVTLDVEMPGMDGLETLRAIQRLNATKTRAAEVGVIMVSAHTKRGADVTMQALRDGAFDFVAKPSGPRTEENLERLRQQGVLMLQENRRRVRATGHGPHPAPGHRHPMGRTDRPRPGLPPLRAQPPILRSPPHRGLAPRRIDGCVKHGPAVLPLPPRPAPRPLHHHHRPRRHTPDPHQPRTTDPRRGLNRPVTLPTSDVSAARPR